MTTALPTNSPIRVKAVSYFSMAEVRGLGLAAGSFMAGLARLEHQEEAVGMTMFSLNALKQSHYD